MTESLCFVAAKWIGFPAKHPAFIIRDGAAVLTVFIKEKDISWKSSL